MRNVTEKAFMSTVLDFAKLTHWMTYHAHDSRRSQPGFPDIVMIRPPRLLFCELKSETGQLSQAQQHWLALLRLVPCIETFVWRPSDWLAIEATLKR